jgi:anti-sigma regulatory factor (Ser/Thr protein kinase)
MIDLSRTRAEFLAEIEALDPESEPLSDITDARIATADVRVRIRGHAKEDLFPVLDLALSERFAALPREPLLRDLLIPVRKALGNAQKHGNGHDPAKTVAVEIVLTRRGALIAITDEGPGFDVARTFQCFREEKNYFVNEGSGFRNLHRARSAVSYEHGGRTVLLCYRPMDDAAHGSPPCSAAVEGLPTAAGGSSAGGHTRPNVLDSKWIQTCLSAEVAEFARHGANIESCRIYAARGGAAHAGHRYVVRVARRDGTPPETRMLTARHHRTADAAEADFQAATHLYKAKVGSRLRIPRPVARLAGEPRLVLYDFNPWMDLWEYLTSQGGLDSVRHAAERAGQSLSAVHRGPVLGPGVASAAVDQGLPAMMARAETTLQALPGKADLVNRFRACVHPTQERLASGRQRAMAPIHGSVGWDCIHYGVDGRFYLYRFEKSRLSDPGLDLGGFAADLLCFTLAYYDAEAYRVCRDDLLKHYNAEAQSPIGAEDLRVYTVLALCQRLARSDLRPPVGEGQLVAALDASLRDGLGACEKVAGGVS